MTITLPRGCRGVAIDGRTFTVDALGTYDELIAVPLALLEMAEDHQNLLKVERYAEMYRNGSPFPAISVCGPTSQFPTYRIINGHHRYLAAQQVKARTLDVWTCAYVEYKLDCCKQPFASLARISETSIGHRLAQALDMRWCIHCGSSLNMTDPTTDLCRSCEIGYRVVARPDRTEFSEYVRTLGCDCPNCRRTRALVPVHLPMGMAYADRMRSTTALPLAG
jgi:hypothetical protein